MLVGYLPQFTFYALVLLLSFSEISQGGEIKQNNVMKDIFKTRLKDHKFRNRRAGKVECGRKGPSPKVIGGTDATPGEWPWQVIIDYKKDPGPHWCGGSILTPYWIVSAAHCFEDSVNPQDYTITIGEHDLRKEEGNEQRIPIEKIILHPNFTTFPPDYDVALVKLKSPINFNGFARPVCLPKSEPGTGNQSNCYVTGWGNTETGEGAQILQQVKVPLVPYELCKRVYTELGSTITPRMRCAGYIEEGIDACGGDSGGPLVCEEDFKWYLVGIISWGYECARGGFYGVYADVVVLKSWVQETINKG